MKLYPPLSHNAQCSPIHSPPFPLPPRFTTLHINSPHQSPSYRTPYNLIVSFIAPPHSTLPHHAVRHHIILIKNSPYPSHPRNTSHCLTSTFKRPITLPTTIQQIINTAPTHTMQYCHGQSTQPRHKLALQLTTTPCTSFPPLRTCFPSGPALPQPCVPWKAATGSFCSLVQNLQQLKSRKNG